MSSPNHDLNSKERIAPYLWNRLNDHGLRPGDEAIIRPVHGPIRNQKIDRTSLWLRKQNPEDVFSSLEWQSPIASSDADYSLRLVGGPSGQEHQGRYLLSAHTGIPFILNGQVSYQSFLSRGDRLQLAGDEVHFSWMKNESPAEQGASLQYFLEERRPLLIIGETGTGKGHWVKNLHAHYFPQLSTEHINISAFGSQLIESELFGHVKGSFTGAGNDRVGAFRAAKNGILFLDEMDSLSLELQAKLLVALESGKVRPVGADRDYAYHCQVIVGYGQDPNWLVSNQKLRRDLFFRLKAFGEIRLPCLRDCPTLVENFCIRFAEEKGVGISPELIQFYCTQAWPGNYRQLKAHLEHKLYIRSSKKLIFDESDENLIDLSQDLSEIEESGAALTMRQLKRAYALKMYHRSQGNISLTAKKLEITPITLKGLIAGNED